MGGRGDAWGKDAGWSWVLYSQFRIEDVQVAQIVCVVGRAEPGQNQEQQSLHGQPLPPPPPLLSDFPWSWGCLLSCFPFAPFPLLHLQFCDPGRADPPSPHSARLLPTEALSDVIKSFTSYLSNSPRPLASALPLLLYLCLCELLLLLLQAGCLVISAAEPNGLLARGWRRR